MSKVISEFRSNKKNATHIHPMAIYTVIEGIVKGIPLESSETTHFGTSMFIRTQDFSKSQIFKVNLEMN